MNLFLEVWIHYYIVFYPNFKKCASIPLFPSTKGFEGVEGDESGAHAG
jgi:hypothetical protein